MPDDTVPTPVDDSGEPRPRVVYLLGAGATQGCISHLGSRHSLVMNGLADAISEQLRLKTLDKYADDPGITRLVNEVMMSEGGLDFEQVITFLEDSPTLAYREFASDLREVFSLVLRDRLGAVEKELGESHSRLYAALVDMYDIRDIQESLGGFLTLNYDVLLEHAIAHHLELSVDYGVALSEPQPIGPSVRVLKMHGSFGWSQGWPIRAELRHSTGVWIPPGIRKPKNDYPFNVIWGLARELLECDVLRIIGCNLGPNDWDLVSLLFSTRYAHATALPYNIEVISGFETVERIRGLFPYLGVRWLPDLPSVGPQIVGELLGSAPQPFAALSEDRQGEVIARARDTIHNPFAYWLTQMGELMTTELGDLTTKSRIFQQFVDERQ